MRFLITYILFDMYLFYSMILYTVPGLETFPLTVFRLTAAHASNSGCAGAIVKSECNAKGTPSSTNHAKGHIL
jgi:hypothetical protein